MDTSAARRNGPVRIAGTVGLVGGLLSVVVDVYELLTLPIEVSMAASLRNVLFQLTAIAALAGLAALGAAGSTWWARLGIGVTFLGFVVLISGELIEPFDPATGETFFGIAPLLAAPGLVLAGVGVLRARRWSGWRRFVTLACGVYLVVVFLPVVISTGTDAGFLAAVIGWGLGLAALGLAVAQEASVPTDSHARARVA